jgi:FkbM family methyltransferase
LIRLHLLGWTRISSIVILRLSQSKTTFRGNRYQQRTIGKMFYDVNNRHGCIRYFSNDANLLPCQENSMFWEQDYVENYLTGIIRRSKVVFDIGAHVGSHTLMYKSINPECTVHAFEPQKPIFDLLEYNIKKNNIASTYAYNVAVGNKNDLVEMNPYSIDGPNAMESIEYGTDKMFSLAGLQIGEGGQQVTMIRLDDFMIGRCDFMKIDVEGYEPHVLLGAERTIAEYRPVISFEYNHKKADDIEIETFDVLKMYNYKYQLVHGENWIARPNRTGE